MGQLFSFSLASSLVLTALYLPYKWLLSAEKMPWQNRLTLLSVYLLALVAVPVAGMAGSGSAQALADVDVTGLVPGGVVAAADGSQGLSLWNVLLGVYVCGIAVLLFWGVAIAMRLRSVLAATVPADVDGTEVLVSGDRALAPFSIGDRIVVSVEDMESPCLPLVVAHERIHVRFCHWADLALGYAVCLVQWYSPVSWLMLREVRAVHEYQADAGAIGSGANIKDYQMLLIKKAVGYRFQSFANSLNHSNLKTRITMMYSKKPTGLRRLTPLVLVPALVAAVYVTATPAVASVIRNAESTALTDDKSNKNQSSGQTTGDKIEVVAYEGTIEYASSKPEGKVYDEPETSPQYPGGIEAMMKKLSEVLKYPEEAMNENRQGRVVVRFIVDRTGKVCDPTIAQSVSPDLDRAAIDAVMQLDNFTPGTVEGKPVNVYFALPVMFSLREEKNQKAS